MAIEDGFSMLSVYGWNDAHKALFLAAGRSGDIMWKLTSRASKMCMASWIPQAFLESRPLAGPGEVVIPELPGEGS